MRPFSLIKNIIFSILITLFTLCAFFACASIGSPGGGETDIEPPKFVKSNPAPNSINFSGNKIEIVFDEYIQLDKPSEKVVVTPPQIKAPGLKALGKSVIIEMKDSLVKDVTYTFDFTDAIVDNNEKNPLEGFTFAFSTGNVVDSLIISGLLLNAENLEPMPGIMVGLHSDLTDSAFISRPFIRTSKTNDKGEFWIRNISPGRYRVFALNDQNRNYYFDQPSEAVAFLDEIIVPSFEETMRLDTLWVDSLTIDTIREIVYNRFTPDDLKLFLSEEIFRPQYLIRGERTEKQKFNILFNAPITQLPEIKLLNHNKANDWYVMELQPDQTTLTYWVKDSLVYQRDSISIEINYLADDSLSNLVALTDTLHLNLRKRNLSKDKEKQEEIKFLDVQMNTKGMIDVYDTLKITFSEPVLDFKKEHIHFQQKVDTLWEDRSFNLKQDSLNPRVYWADYKFSYNTEFQLIIDSASVHGIYGLWNNSFKSSFKVKAEEEYGHVYVLLAGNDYDGFGELLDGGDKPIRKAPLKNGELAFENLNPGKYYLRYIEDRNNNGVWDPSKYKEGIPPETVYYYESVLEVRKYSEIEQNWNVKATPIERQKPLEITKNKPVVKQPKKNEENRRK
ncbi:Ig-like domain-containing protein [Bacteroidales bacterium OttesenSCG-928-M11]|nr:Ig-like domain-containing protein [Bacteroidales bacterium OttesenSCG-928-M11]